MHPRASQLIAELALVPHPEGGHYREVFRAGARVAPADGRPPRAAITVIYFLLVEGEVSRWHRVASDEVWHHCEGGAVALMTAAAGFGEVVREVLGPFDREARPVRVVPACRWQAAVGLGAYSLVSCCVGPGFDFADFSLLRDAPEAAADFARNQPAHAPFL